VPQRHIPYLELAVHNFTHAAQFQTRHERGLGSVMHAQQKHGVANGVVPKVNGLT
jgi:hypothetical protein